MNCYNDGPEHCTGCLYCDAARSAGPDEPVTYPISPEDAQRFMTPAEAMARADGTLRDAPPADPLDDDNPPPGCTCPEYNPEDYDGPFDYADACRNCPEHGAGIRHGLLRR